MNLPSIKNGGLGMKPYIVGIRHGIVELDEMDMMRIVKFYNTQRTMEYIEENYPNLEYNIETVAERAREFMEKYDINEDEAIERVIAEAKRESSSGKYTEY